MALQHVANLYKVCNTTDRNGGMNPERYGKPVSALLHRAPAQVDYSITQNRNVFVASNIPGTPLTLFDDLDAAYKFADRRPGRKVYSAEVFGEIITPARVLRIKDWSWNERLTAFWEAVLAGTSLDEFETRAAPAHTVAVFGVVRLTGIADRPASAAPQADEEEDDDSFLGD